MRVVLIHPAGSNWIPGEVDVSTVVNRLAPIGLLSLAAYLERENHETVVFDGSGPYAPTGLERQVRKILAMEPDLVGFSATTSSFPDAVDFAQAIKSARPETLTVVGGVHASAMGAVLLERFASVDFLVLGEGEETLRELASGMSPSGIRGLAYREAGRATTTPARPVIEDLDALPFPAYRRLEGFPKRYHLPLFQSPATPGATLVTSRGCTYGCSYCDRSVYGRMFRSNSAAYIYGHMEHLRRDFGVRHVTIYDDLFTMNRERVVELCEALVERPLGISFNCALRVGHADEEMLRLLKRAGLWMVSLGIETGDPDLLERLKPGLTIDRVRETVDRIRRTGLKVKGLFMAGLPGETPETLRRTSDLTISLGLDEMNLAKFTPFPGAPLWGEIGKDPGFVEDWRLMNCLNFTYVPQGFASKEELQRCYAAAVKRFYDDPAWRRRFVGRAWACRHSFGIFLRNLPALLRARRHFDPDTV